MVWRPGPLAAARLAEVQTYRAFISTVLEERTAAEGRRFGYADVANFAGLKARSFPRDVVVGRKRVSLSSLPKFIRGLGLDRDTAAVFVALVELEHPDCRLDRRTRQSVERELERARSRLRKRCTEIPAHAVQVFTHVLLPKIYAGLHKELPGQTLDQLALTVGLGRGEVFSGLHRLAAHGLAKVVDGRWLATEGPIELRELQGGFREFFAETALAASQASGSPKFHSEQALFSAACVCVRESELPALKIRLRDVLMKFVERAEAPDGDKVVTLNCSFV